MLHKQILLKKKKKNVTRVTIERLLFKMSPFVFYNIIHCTPSIHNNTDMHSLLDIRALRFQHKTRYSRYYKKKKILFILLP